jgi:hypothetical protein
MTTFLPGVPTITITKDIGVSGGTASDGLAHISTVTNLFPTNVITATPEPSLGLFFGSIHFDSNRPVEIEKAQSNLLTCTAVGVRLMISGSSGSLLFRWAV